MKKNIVLAYIITALQYSWFWLGIWVLYYSRFGGYAAVGIIETVMIVTTIACEIPTGVIGDIFGKRVSIIISGLLSGIACIWMGFAPNLLSMVLSVFVMSFGGTFMSGSFEAMIYDSLKEENQVERYKKILGNITAVKLVSMTLCSIIGGYLYTINVGLPFILNGALQLLLIGVSFFISEPKVDTIKYSVKNIVKQNVQGFVQLFKRRHIAINTILMWTLSFVVVILSQGLNDILAVEYGFSETALGYIGAINTFVAAAAIQAYSRLGKKVNSKLGLFISGLLYAISLILSFKVSMILGGVLIAGRYVLEPIIENEVSVLLNLDIESKYRATTLSTFSMLKNIPYALSVYLLTSTLDEFSSFSMAQIIGVMMIVSVIIYGAWQAFQRLDSARKHLQ